MIGPEPGESLADFIFRAIDDGALGHAPDARAADPALYRCLLCGANLLDSHDRATCDARMAGTAHR